MNHLHRIRVPDISVLETHRLGFQRDLWAFLLEGSQQALRLRVEGRSKAKGPIPKWLKDSTQVEFLGYGNHECELVFTSPALGSTMEQDDRQPLFGRQYDPEQSALELLEESVQDALSLNRDSAWMDDGFLDTLESNLKPIFKSTPQLEWANGRVLNLNPEAVASLDTLRRETPPKQWCRVSGKLEVIRHSDHAFALVLTDGRAIRGVADPELDPLLKLWWGEKVVADGYAVFRPSQNLLRIEAQKIELAEGRDEVWSAIPEPLFPDLKLQTLHEVQGTKSGLAALIGRWPGNESDEELFSALQALR